MQLYDCVYGGFDVTEPLLTKLIESKPVQRLKKISQFGIPSHLCRSGYKAFTRYEHSIGVMFLLRSLGATLEEQAAGLLHDVSHTAFSHIIDYVFGDPSVEDYQDNLHSQVVSESEIPVILARYGLNAESVSNIEKFGLLERPAPDLCADRVDYALREMMGCGRAADACVCYSGLIVNEGKIVFSSLEKAALFANHYARLYEEQWGDADSRARYLLFSEALKAALADETISKTDFKEHDVHVFCKLESSVNPEVKKPLQLLARRTRFQPSSSREATVLPGKFRCVDPLFLEKGKAVRLSSVDLQYAKLIENQRKAYAEGIKVLL